MRLPDLIDGVRRGEVAARRSLRGWFDSAPAPQRDEDFDTQMISVTVPASLVVLHAGSASPKNV